MKEQLIEAGQVVNTHGIQGEVKIQPWADTPDFLCQFHTIYLNGQPKKLLSATVHKNCVLARLEGVEDVNAAMLLKGQMVSISRADASLPEGRYFLVDLIGLEVRDADSGAVLGTLDDVLTPPANQVYVVHGGTREYLIPAVEDFIVETNVDGGYMRVRLLEGM